MKSVFAELPHNLIIKIIQIYNDRKKYDKVVEQINKVTTYDKFCPSIREMMNEVYDAGGGFVGYYVCLSNMGMGRKSSDERS